MVKIGKQGFLLVLLCICFIFSGALAVPSNAENTKSTEKISIDVRNADIRDVLSALSININKNIMFTGTPVNVNFSIQDVSGYAALDYLLKTVGMTSLENSNVIVVGTREALTKDFFTNISLTKFSLKYISSDVISKQIETLGIPAQKITMDTNTKAIWIQGLPRDLAKVHELIGMLDRAENINGDSASSNLALTPVVMKYITAEKMNEMLSNMRVPTGIVLESNNMTLWVYGSSNVVAQINDIKNKVDIPENAHRNDVILTFKKLRYLTTEEIIPLLEKMEQELELQMDIALIGFARSYQTLWMYGKEEEIKVITSLIDKMDVEANINDNVFSVLKLNNITAKEAQKRLSQLNLKGVSTYTFNFPEFSKSILVFCPSDYNLFVMNYLAKFDKMTERIKVPVDFSDVASGSSRLTARRDLIVSLTGIPASSFTISNNVARDDKIHYIMYLEETSENIQRVKDVIKYIDDPTLENAAQ